MLTFVVSRLVRLNIRWLNAGKLDAVMRMCAKDVQFAFPGRSPLSGSFRGKDEFRAWAKRWNDLGAVLQIHSFAVGGWLWDLRIFYRFIDTIPMSGQPDYVRTGAQFMRVRWGLVKEYEIFVDDPLTEVMAAGLI